MKTIRTCLRSSITILLLLSTVAHADHPVGRGKEQALDLSVCKVKIGTTLDDFRKLIPFAVEGREAGVPRGPNQYHATVSNGTDNPISVYFYFTNDDRVRSITIEHSADLLKVVNDPRGMQMIDYLKMQFGEPSKEWTNLPLDEKGHAWSWFGPNVLRLVSYLKREDGTGKIFVRECTEREASIAALPETSLLGFDTENGSMHAHQLKPEAK